MLRLSTFAIAALLVSPDNVAAYDFSDFVSFDCAATPYDNGATCEVAGAFCEWHQEDIDGSGNAGVTDCYCGDFFASSSAAGLEWDCYTWEGWTEIPEFDCPSEPFVNGTSCSVNGAYCFWEDNTSKENSDWSDCYCYGDEWECYDSTSTSFDTTDIDISDYDCPDVPFENGTSCAEAHAFCVWEDDTKYTDCWCSPDSSEWDCYEFENFDLPIDYTCPEAPVSNGTTCDTNGAFCLWEPNPEEGFTECFCNDEWECYEWNWSDFNDTAPTIVTENPNCGDTPFENGTSCEPTGTFCYWEDDTSVTDCFCSAATTETPSWECYSWDFNDDFLAPSSCPVSPVANNSACSDDGAICFWEDPDADNSFIDCFCFESKWECYSGNIFPDVFEGSSSSCPVDVAATGDKCNMIDGEFCVWEGEDGTMDECFCGGGTFDCVKGVVHADPKLFAGTLPFWGSP